MLSSAQISENYQSACQMATELIRKHHLKNVASDAEGLWVEELAQSAVATESVILMIQEHIFNATDYLPVLVEALDETRRLFFPDTAKRRFLALDAFPGLEIKAPLSDVTPAEDKVSSRNHLNKLLSEKLDPENLKYFQQSFGESAENIEYYLQRLMHFGAGGNQWQLANFRLGLMRRFYPEGKFPDILQIDCKTEVEPRQLKDIYLQVYLGIQPAFPQFFLAIQGKERSAVITEFLISEILTTTPLAVLEKNDETFCIRHRLQPVYRYFNYSLNRVLCNAFPKEVQPWHNSRTAEGYWEVPENRIAATKWLVEERLSLLSETLYRNPLNRRHFTSNGLSFMFNHYYNSVSKALSDAYPQLNPWEYGKLSLDYWNDDNAARAVRWVIERRGWEVDQLSALAHNGEFHKKTFSEMGLATLFEKKFSRNLFKAVDCAWPGRFQPWEFGRVPKTYWEEPENIFSASRWIANREGYDEGEIIPAIRNNKLTLRHLKAYSIGAALRRWCGGSLEKMFAPLFWKETRLKRREQKLMRRASHLKRKRGPASILEYLLHGFFIYDAQVSGQRQRQQLERIERRIRRRLRDENDNLSGD